MLQNEREDFNIHSIIIGGHEHSVLPGNKVWVLASLLGLVGYSYLGPTGVRELIKFCRLENKYQLLRGYS